MEQTSAELTQQIDEERRDLDRNLAELSTRAKEALDWRDQVRKRPAVALGAAFVGGFLLAGTRRRSPRRALERVTEGEPRRMRRSPEGPITGALVAAATTALGKMLAGMLPGFHEEHEKRNGSTNGSGRSRLRDREDSESPEG